MGEEAIDRGLRSETQADATGSGPGTEAGVRGSPVAAKPKKGHYFTDGKRLIRILDTASSHVEAEDASTYMVERITSDVFYRDWRKVKRKK